LQGPTEYFMPDTLEKKSASRYQQRRFDFSIFKNLKQDV